MLQIPSHLTRSSRVQNKCHFNCFCRDTQRRDFRPFVDTLELKYQLECIKFLNVQINVALERTLQFS
jgi:hypothetical protein